MTIEVHVHKRLSDLGLECELVSGEVVLQRDDGMKTKIRFDEEWREAFKKYQKAKSIKFDEQNRVLTLNSSVEIQIQRLALGTILQQESYLLGDPKSISVEIAPSSYIFKLAFFDSTEYQSYFKDRVFSRFTQSKLSFRKMEMLVPNTITATYKFPGRKIPTDINEKARAAIKSSLFKIAVEYGEPFLIWTPKNRRRVNITEKSSSNLAIPKGNYDDNIVSYYMLAKASPFPSQSFLSFYHVLEYFFLRVSEKTLHTKLNATLNDVNFNSGKDWLDKIISVVRGQDSKSDETELLRSVLENYVEEDDIIKFIEGLETDNNEKIYSKERLIFGEKIFISLKKGHVISNSAKLLKHIRNAIVHSSDQYKREDCHIPFSETEDMIAEFIPLVRFLAEKVVFGTAS